MQTATTTTNDLLKLPEVRDQNEIAWHPVMGKLSQHSNFFAFRVDERGEDAPCFHIFPKKKTASARMLNYNADEHIAKKMIEVLKERYPERGYRVEFYGGYAKNLKVDALFLEKHVHGGCFCVVLKENPFISSDDYRLETLQLLDAALSSLGN